MNYQLPYVDRRSTTRSAVLASARKLLKNKPFVYEDKENPIFNDEMLPKEIRDLHKKKGLLRISNKALLWRQANTEGSGV